MDYSFDSPAAAPGKERPVLVSISRFKSEQLNPSIQIQMALIRS
jgi:hypothetical protein